MARPQKYPWDKIKLDFESGLQRADIHRKYDVPYNRINEHVKTKGWVQSEQAKAIIKDFDDVSYRVSELKAENPELVKNTIDIIIDRHPQFKRAMVALSGKLFNKMMKLADDAKAQDINNLAKGMQTITDTLGISQRHANTTNATQLINNFDGIKLIEE